jgi:hypothetical protein
MCGLQVAYNCVSLALLPAGDEPQVPDQPQPQVSRVWHGHHKERGLQQDDLRLLQGCLVLEVPAGGGGERCVSHDLQQDMVSLTQSPASCSCKLQLVQLIQLSRHPR